MLGLFLATRNFARTLSAGKYFIWFGLSQVAIFGFSLARFPLIAKFSDTQVVDVHFFWLGLQPLIALSVSGSINKHRIEVAQGLSVTKLSNGARNFLLTIAMSGLIVTVLALVNLTNAWWSGLGPALLALTVSALASPYVGHQQGAGFAHRQFAYSIVGGGMMLALTYFLVKSETWTNSPYSAKTLSLSLVLFVGSCLPLIFVVLKSRREIVFSKSAEPTNSRSLWVALFEIASLLPPAMLGAFDVFALSTYAGQGELSTYGYISRLVLITTVVPSALNAQISNFANRLNSRSKEVWLPLLFLEIATIPGVCILLFVGVDLVRLLSGGTVEVPFYHLLPTALSAFLIPIWVLLSQMVSSKVDARLDLGRSILLYLLPVEVAATFILGASWGSLGVFSATTLGYGLACLIAVRKLRKMERT